MSTETQNTEKPRLFSNYYPLPSRAKTIVSLLARHGNQITIHFKTWLLASLFESVNDDGTFREPFAPLCFSFPIAGSAYDGIMSDAENLTIFSRMDSRIREIGKLNSFNSGFDSYTIDCEKKIITIQPEPDNDIVAPVMNFPEPMFSLIVENTENKQIIGNALQFCWKYGALLDKSGYLASLVAPPMGGE